MSDSEKQQLMRDYWLGRLSEAEVVGCELEWFSNDEDAQLLEAVRDDLIDEFLAGGLVAGDKLLFEKNFLAVPTNLRDVAITQVYRRTIDVEKVESFLAPTVVSTATTSTESKKSFWLAFFAPSRLAFGAFVLLIASGTFLFLTFQKNGSLPDKIAKTNVSIMQPSPEKIVTPTENPTATNKPLPKNKNTNTKSAPEKSLTPKVETTPSLPTPLIPKVETSPKPPPSFNPIQILGLAAPLRSGNGSKPSVQLQKTTSTLRLKVPMPVLTELYQSYSAKIVSETDGQIVWQNRLPDLNDKQAGEEISVDVPTKKLIAGGYRISLIGERPDGTSKELRPTSFNVQKN